MSRLHFGRKHQPVAVSLRRPQRHRQTWFVRLCVLLFTGFTLNACGEAGKTIEWKQEVPLQDGRVIVVERISRQTGKIMPENVIMESEQTLSFAHPDTQERIRWTLPDGLLPAALDFDGKTPYFVLRAYTVSDYNKWDCPNPPWLVYRYEEGEWGRVRFEKLPAGIVSQNLLPMFKMSPLKEGGGRVTVRQLDDYWRHFAPSERVRAKTISREKISPIGKGCDEDVLVRLGRQTEIDKRR